MELAVEVEEAGGAYTTLEENQYNGLTWLIVKRADTSAAPNGLDEMKVIIYSAGWQMLEERVDTGWISGFAADKVFQTIYGIRYIDDVLCRSLDHDNDGNYEERGTLTYYHLTDDQFSTVAVLDGSANLIERVAYDPCGKARHQWMADQNGDGTITTTKLGTQAFCVLGYTSISTELPTGRNERHCSISRL